MAPDETGLGIDFLWLVESTDVYYTAAIRAGVIQDGCGVIKLLGIPRFLKKSGICDMKGINYEEYQLQL